MLYIFLPLLLVWVVVVALRSRLFTWFASLSEYSCFGLILQIQQEAKSSVLLCRDSVTYIRWEYLLSH
jgi:hypothetical protein